MLQTVIDQHQHLFELIYGLSAIILNLQPGRRDFKIAREYDTYSQTVNHFESVNF